MRITFTFCFLLLSMLCKAQFSFLNGIGTNQWSSFTVFTDPKDLNHLAVYCSNEMRGANPVKVLKHDSKDGYDIMLVTLGNDPTQYVLIFPLDFNSPLIMTDRKQMFRKEFVLDSKIINDRLVSQQKKPPLSDDTIKGLLTFFKLLLL